MCIRDRYDVGVTRHLCGHVLIEADSADEAEKIAYDRYIKPVSYTHLKRHDRVLARNGRGGINGIQNQKLFLVRR